MQQVQVSSKAMNEEIEKYSTAFHQYPHATQSIGHGNASEGQISTCRAEAADSKTRRYPTCHKEYAVSYLVAVRSSGIARIICLVGHRVSGGQLP